MVDVLKRQPTWVERFAPAIAAAGEGMGGMLAGNIKQQKTAQDKQLMALALRQQGIDPSVMHMPEKAQAEFFKNKFEETSKSKKIADELISNKTILRNIEQRRGLEPGSLDAYVNDPKMAEQVTRPPKEPKKTQASQPIDPEQLAIIKQIRSSPEFQQADPLQKYQMMTDAGVSKENAQAESEIAAKQTEIKQKGVQSAYEAQKDFINETTQKYQGFETEMKPRLLQMRSIPDEDIVGPTAAVFLEHLGIPLGSLEKPGSELFNKLSQDLLKGLPEQYGNRILKVEVDNFLKTIPTLMNSPDGRRMIASNMLKLGEMKEVYYNEMRKMQTQALDANKPLPPDFQQRVFDQVKPQIDRINNEFVKLAEVTSVPKDTIPFFNPNSEIEFVPKEHAQWAQEHGGRRIW